MSALSESISRRLQGKTAIVTGGARGIGLATAQKLVDEGVSVVIVDLNADQVEQAVEELIEGEGNKKALGVVQDVRDEAGMQTAVQKTLDAFGQIDILVHCAGILRPPGETPKMMADMSFSEWETVISTNLTGTFLSNKAILPAMMARKSGHIVNVSSVSGKKGRAFDTAYCASKFGVAGMTEALAEEVRPYGIKVQVVYPDAVDTKIWEQNGALPAPADALPASRVADLIVYLLAMPVDTVLSDPVIAPFRSRRRKSKKNSSTP